MTIKKRLWRWAGGFTLALALSISTSCTTPSPAEPEHFIELPRTKGTRAIILQQYVVIAPIEHADPLRTYAEATGIDVTESSDGMLWLGPTPSAYEALWLASRVPDAHAEWATHLSPMLPESIPPEVVATARAMVTGDTTLGGATAQSIDGVGTVWSLGLEFGSGDWLGVTVLALEGGGTEILSQQEWPHSMYLNPEGLILLVSEREALAVGEFEIRGRGTGFLDEGVRWRALSEEGQAFDEKMTPWFVSFNIEDSEGQRLSEARVLRLEQTDSTSASAFHIKWSDQVLADIETPLVRMTSSPIEISKPEGTSLLIKGIKE